MAYRVENGAGELPLRNEVYQSNLLINARKSFDLLGMRIFILGLRGLNPHFSKKDKYFDEEFKETFIPSSELTQVFRNTKYLSRIKATCQKLFNVTVELKNSDRRLELIHVFKKLEYEPSKGLYLQFADEMRPHLLNLVETNGYTRIRVEYLFNLSSPYAIRLLELLLQYQNFECFRQLKEVRRKFTVDELRYLLNVPENAYKNRPDNFKKYVLDTPIKEITERTPYKVHYKAIKTGRRVYAFEFFLDNFDAPVEVLNGHRTYFGNDAIVSLCRMGFSEKVAQEIYLKCDDVKDCFKRIATAQTILGSQKKPVSNKLGFLRRAIEQNWKLPERRPKKDDYTPVEVPGFEIKKNSGKGSSSKVKAPLTGENINLETKKRRSTPEEMWRSIINMAKSLARNHFRETRPGLSREELDLEIEQIFSVPPTMPDMSKIKTGKDFMDAAGMILVEKGIEDPDENKHERNKSDVKKSKDPTKLSNIMGEVFKQAGVKVEPPSSVQVAEDRNESGSMSKLSSVIGEALGQAGVKAEPPPPVQVTEDRNKSGSMSKLSNIMGEAFKRLGVKVEPPPPVQIAEDRDKSGSMSKLSSVIGGALGQAGVKAEPPPTVQVTEDRNKSGSMSKLSNIMGEAFKQLGVKVELSPPVQVTEEAEPSAETESATEPNSSKEEEDKILYEETVSRYKEMEESLNKVVTSMHIETDLLAKRLGYDKADQPLLPLTDEEKESMDTIIKVSERTIPALAFFLADTRQFKSELKKEREIIVLYLQRLNCSRSLALEFKGETKLALPTAKGKFLTRIIKLLEESFTVDNEEKLLRLLSGDLTELEDKNNDENRSVVPVEGDYKEESTDSTPKETSSQEHIVGTAKNILDEPESFIAKELESKRTWTLRRPARQVKSPIQDVHVLLAILHYKKFPKDNLTSDDLAVFAKKISFLLDIIEENFENIINICKLHLPKDDENDYPIFDEWSTLLKTNCEKTGELFISDLYYVEVPSNIKVIKYGDHFGEDSHEGLLLYILYRNYQMSYLDFLEFVIKKFIKEKPRESYELRDDR